MAQFEQTPSANMLAAKGLGKLIAVIIILAVTGLGDVMYLQLMSSKFPSGGPLLVFCYAGAFAAFLAMGYLLIGKTISFRPGPQTLAAWGLLVVELVLASLNIMLVFSGTAHVTGFMAVWLSIAPATPVVVMTGVVIVFFLDPDLKKKHQDMELQDNIDAMERGFTLLQYKTELKLKHETLKLSEQFLMEELQHPENIDMLRGNAAQMFAHVVSGFTGFSIAPRVNNTRVVASNRAEPVQLAQTASIDISEPQTEHIPTVNTSGSKKK